MRVRRALTTAVTAVTIAGSAAVVPTAARADVAVPIPTGATAYSSGLYVTPGSGINSNVAITGLVGGLIGWAVDPLLTTATNTLTTALIGDGTSTNPGLLKLMVTALSSLLGSQAGTPAAMGQTNAYNTTAWLGTGALAPIVNVTSQTVAGNTKADSGSGTVSGYSTIASPIISVLGLPIAQLGTMTSSSTCPTTGSATSSLQTTAALSTVSLLGGLLTFSVGANNLIMVQVGSLPAVSLSQLQTQTLSLAGLNVSVSSTGSNALRIGISLGLSSLLTAFGLGSLGVLTDLSNSTLQLVATVGPGQTSTSNRNNSASAAGLDIKVGLSGTLALQVPLNVVGVALTVSPLSGSADGDLLDMQLGYTSCAGGAAGVSVWYPAGLI